MTAYGEDDRGRLFRWDGGLAAWFRIPPDDDEYDTALCAVYGARAAGTGQRRPTACRPDRVARRRR